MIDREIRDARNKAIDDAVASMDNRMRHLFNQGFELGKKMAEKEAARGKKETSTSGWIPVSERLPEEEGQYLVTLDLIIWGKEIEMSNWVDGEWAIIDSHAVVAWMPLPEPWKGEEK